MTYPYNRIICGDALEALWERYGGRYDCCVTSPPYYHQRDYSHPDQIGQEDTPEEYIQKLVKVFRRVRDTLKPTATLWLNLSDSFQHKQLLGIPWRVALALQSDGWKLRQDIIWHKENPMPESVTDRCTRAHEYIFMFSKQDQYYYDAESIKTEAKNPADDVRRMTQANGGITNTVNSIRRKSGPPPGKQHDHSRRHAGFNDRWDAMPREEQQALKANRRSVWSVATRPFNQLHFAVMPQQLVDLCLRAGCPPDGTVLDPFAGAGTTCLVARKQQKHFIGIELNPAYVELAERRLQEELGLFRHAGSTKPPTEPPPSTLRPPQMDFFRNSVTSH